MIPGILYILPKLRALSELPPEEAVMALALFGLGFLAMIVYLLLISIIFALPRYSVVIDDVGAIEGIKNGFVAFMHNKVAVFLLWLILLVVTTIVMPLGAIPRIGGIISVILSVIIIQPLTVIWWSRLYLSIINFTHKGGEDRIPPLP